MGQHRSAWVSMVQVWRVAMCLLQDTQAPVRRSADWQHTFGCETETWLTMAAHLQTSPVAVACTCYSLLQVFQRCSGCPRLALLFVLTPPHGWLGLRIVNLRGTGVLASLVPFIVNTGARSASKARTVYSVGARPRICVRAE